MVHCGEEFGNNRKKEQMINRDPDNEVIRYRF